MRFALFWVVVVCLAATPAPTASGPASAYLLEPGDFHGVEVLGPTGPGWLALITDGNRSAWQSVTIEIQTVHDEVTDDAGVATGKRVSVRERTSGDVVLLAYGLGDLARTSVITALNEPRDLHNGDVVPLAVRGHEYRLRVVNQKPEATQAIGAGSALLLNEGDVSQSLYSLPDFGDEPAWRLLWAGDLDGDGKLDLYLDLSNHYNVSNRMLFLSSRAKPGELLGKTVVFATTGC